MSHVQDLKGGTEDMLSPARESESPYSPLQLHFLRRLNRLLRLRSEPCHGGWDVVPLPVRDHGHGFAETAPTRHIGSGDAGADSDWLGIAA